MKKQKALNVALAIIAILAAIYVVNLFIAIAIRPSGPYEPLVSTAFFFDKTGAQNELNFTPLFLRNHEIALLASQPFPVSEKFYWKIHAEVFRFGFKIDDKIINETSRTLEGKSNLCTSISFDWIRTFDFFPGRTVVRISVLQGDQESSKYTHIFTVVVRPSPYI